MAREKRKFSVDDKQAEVYVGSGGRQTLVLPAGLELYKPKKSGTFRIEVIPFEVGKRVNAFAPGYRFSPAGKWHWNVIYRSHNGIGPDNASVVCVHQTFGKACPICEEKARLGRSAHPDDKKLAGDLFAKERQLLLVAERDERSGVLGPIQLWEVSTWCFKKQLDLFIQAADPEDKEPYAKFWYPDRGLTLKIVGSEESMGGGGGNYSKYSVMEMKPRREPLPDDILDHGFELYSCVRERTYADIKAIFSGVEAEPEDAPGADADDFPVRAAAPEPADNEYPLDEPEPEPAPAPRRAPPAETKAPTFSNGQAVTFVNKDGPVKGLIVGVDDERQICQVKIAGRERPVTLDFEELTPAASAPPAAPAPVPDPDPPAPRAAAPRRAPAPPPDEDDDIPPPPRRTAGAR